MRELTVEGSGYAATPHNLMLILRYAPQWQDTIAWDAFAQRVVFLREPPFRDDFRARDLNEGLPNPYGVRRRNLGRFLGREVTDADTMRTAAWIEATYRIKASPDLCGRVFSTLAEAFQKHPVRDMLRSITWDRVERLGRPGTGADDPGAPSWLTRYFGAPDTPYVRQVGRWWLVSAIARVMDPGCQADYALVLEGEQGVGKSAGLRALSEPWFSEDVGDINHLKEAQQQLAGVWIVELAEFDAIDRAGLAAAKKFLSQPSDRYRPPYGKHPRDYPRQCVFAATINAAQYLRDVTGNRRWWPVRTGRSDLELLREERALLWAEAFAAYLAGERWFPDPNVHGAMLRAEQEARQFEDPWSPIVYDMLAARARDGKSLAVQTSDVLAYIGLDRTRWTGLEEQRISRIMTLFGRTKRRLSTGKAVWDLAFDGKDPIFAALPGGEPSAATAPIVNDGPPDDRPYNDDAPIPDPEGGVFAFEDDRQPNLPFGGYDDEGDI